MAIHQLAKAIYIMAEERYAVQQEADRRALVMERFEDSLMYSLEGEDGRWADYYMPTILDCKPPTSGKPHYFRNYFLDSEVIP